MLRVLVPRGGGPALEPMELDRKMTRYHHSLTRGLALAVVLGTADRVWAQSQETGFGRPLDVSLDGNRSDWLFYMASVPISLLFVIMVGILLWACLAHRDTPSRTAHYEHGVGKRHLAFTAIISAVIFFGVDGLLLVKSYNDLKDAFWHFPTAAERPVEIEVLAQQWAWNIRYPGPDGKFNTADDIVTLNEMHIPVGKPVMVRLRSKDVIHSFYLPNFRTKQDTVPGATTQLWFQAKQAGVFDIGCAQHCGVSHYKMHGTLTISSPEEFSEWLAEAEIDARRRYDEADAEARWGWDWES